MLGFPFRDDVGAGQQRCGFWYVFDEFFSGRNRFDPRHRKVDQRGDYDEAFLDWIFWWYLATVERWS